MLALLLALQTPVARVDWPVFLARHDLVWDRLPTRWGESAFIGNGRLGATIDAQGGVLGWTINRTDVVHDQSRFPIGRVFVKTIGTAQAGSARLTLWDAEASGTVTTDRGEVRWRSFTAARPSVIVVVLEGRGGERDLDLDWAPAEARPPRKVARKEAPRVTRDSAGAFVIDLRRAASVVLAPEVASPLPDARPVALPPGRNPFPILQDGLGTPRP